MMFNMLASLSPRSSAPVSQTWMARPSPRRNGAQLPRAGHLSNRRHQDCFAMRRGCGRRRIPGEKLARNSQVEAGRARRQRMWTSCGLMYSRDEMAADTHRLTDRAIGARDLAETALRPVGDHSWGGQGTLASLWRRALATTCRPGWLLVY
jgi:hypothetical protein